jgi:hypothetical protein
LAVDAAFDIEQRKRVLFGYGLNYLIVVEHAIIVLSGCAGVPVRLRWIYHDRRGT